MNRSKLHLTLFLIFTSMIPYSCNKEEEYDVDIYDYPDKGFYGSNILNDKDTVFLADTDAEFGIYRYHSMKAILPNKTSKLRVTIEGKRVRIYQNQGWFTNADPNRYDNYTFQAEGQITADLKIHLCCRGPATIKIYENNSESPTRIKNITLE